MTAVSSHSNSLFTSITFSKLRCHNPEISNFARSSPPQTNKLNRRSSSNFPKCHALGKRTNVYETLTLLNFPATIEEDSVSAVVDEVWSLQYRAAGPICGSAGPFTPPRNRSN
ncbi:hypothetical protein Ndes2437B_g07155 [Nannochloris sp. 'desiccata']